MKILGRAAACAPVLRRKKIEALRPQSGCREINTGLVLVFLQVELIVRILGR